MSNDINKFVAFDPSRIKYAARERVIFKRHRTPNRVGSLFVPETSRYIDRSDLAEVIAVGSGIDDVKAGDTLLLPDHLEVMGKFTHDGDTYTVVSKEQLGQVAVVEP